MSATAAAGGAPRAATTNVLTQRQVWVVFGGVLAGMSLAALDGTIVNTALPTMVADLGGLESYAWVTTAYLLTSTAATPLFGKLSDLYGRRLLFQVAIGTFMVGSLACGISQDMTQLVLSRALQGVGGGGLLALAFAIIGDIVSPRERGRYMAVVMSMFTAASVIGPLLGGFLVESASWRWIFTINIPVGMVALFVTNRALRLPFERRPHRIDVLGSVLMVGAVTVLVLTVEWTGREFGWFSAETIGMFVAFLVLTGGFIWWEGRASEPIIPLRLFHNDVIRVVSALSLVLGGAMYGAMAFVPLFLQGVTGVSPTASGLLIVPMAIGSTVASIYVGRRTAITGRYRHWVILGSGMGAASLVGMSLLAEDTTRLVIGMVSLGLLGASIGMAMPITTLAAQNAVDHGDLGVASGLVTFFRSLGGAVGLALFGAVFNATIGEQVDAKYLQDPRAIKHLPAAIRHDVLDVLAGGVTMVFKVAVPVMIVACVLATRLREVPLRETSGLQHHHDALV
jgi:EmrB/QacA subfamily drug resistance transporter